MTAQTTNEMLAHKRGLHHFPIAFFAVLMGLWGWVLATQAIAGQFPAVLPLAEVLRGVATAVLLIVAGLYGVKALRFPQACAAEWNAPPKLAFFPAISISLLLMATAYLPFAPEFAHVLWIVAVVLQGGLTLAVISSWISHRAFQMGQLSPAWFIPAVGNVIVPVAGAQLGYVELSWLFFSGGLIFWLVLLTLVINRLMFHDPLPGKLLPTLVILIAPPALAFLAYVQLVGEVDSFARVLINVAYVFALLVLIQARNFAKLPFALSWWALSFPVAGLTIASLQFGVLAVSTIHIWIGAALGAVLTLIVLLLALRTLRAVGTGVFFSPEG
ncbi:SLAC1 anion channel family protein [Cognatishimia sp. WU-CL00825]|uniref:SLAC1 anion channel family protein n=1 Tax=Cognatishimia sp. WU-CL00825 TaxID=3127658 RepID=UPI00310B0AF9